METLSETLVERVEQLIRPQQPLLSTTGVQAAIGELNARNERLEEALREIVLQVQELTAAQSNRSAH